MVTEKKVKIYCAYSELIPLDNLILNPRNTNKHPEKQIKVLAKLFISKCVRHPIIVSRRSGFVVAGEGRYLAARENDMESFPIDFQDFKNEAEEYAFLESDNHIARYAEFQEDDFISNIKELDLDIKRD